MAALGDIVTQETDVIERCTVSFDDFMVLWFWASRKNEAVTRQRVAYFCSAGTILMKKIASISTNSKRNPIKARFLIGTMLSAVVWGSVHAFDQSLSPCVHAAASASAISG